jgi:hypothetical protein
MKTLGGKGSFPWMAPSGASHLWWCSFAVSVEGNHWKEVQAVVVRSVSKPLPFASARAAELAPPGEELSRHDACRKARNLNEYAPQQRAPGRPAQGLGPRKRLSTGGEKGGDVRGLTISFSSGS